MDTYPIRVNTCVGTECKSQAKWRNVEPETWFDIPAGAQYYINVPRGGNVNVRRDPNAGKLLASSELLAAVVCEYKCV